jgi:hypothetical protein
MKIQINITKDILRESSGYTNNFSCPLAVAFKRKIGVQPFVQTQTVDVEEHQYKIVDGFNEGQYFSLKCLAESGETINHKVILIKQ